MEKKKLRNNKNRKTKTLPNGKVVAKDPVEGVYSLAIKNAADAFKVGESETEIAEKIKELYPILTPANIQLVIHKGSQMIAAQYNRDSKSIVSLHVKRYNEEIEKLMNKTYEGLIDEDEVDIEGEMTAFLRRKLRINALMICLDVMVQKEKVLQIHSKDTQIKVFNKLNAKIKEKKVMFNLETLSLEEKIDFLQLIRRAKKDSVEVLSVINSTKKEQVIEDIDHEEVVNNNINEVKLINQPDPPKVKIRKGLDDVTKKIHAAMAKKAEREFIRKNGNNGGPKAIDHTDI